MNSLRTLLPALCLAAGLASPVVRADAVTSTTAHSTAVESGARNHWRAHRRLRGTFAGALKKLNVSPEQQTQIKAILAQERPQMKSLRDSTRTTHQAVASASPNDQNYPALLATEKSNALARIQLASDIKTQIYAVLTPEQQAQIPGIIAADRAAHDAQMADHGGHSKS